MSISEKKLKEIRKGLEKSNRLTMNLYRKNGDASLLEMLYLDSDNPQEVAEKFEIPLEVAEKLVDRDKANKEKSPEEVAAEVSKAFNNLWKPQKSKLYDKAFEFVASSGNEKPQALAEALEITVEQAEALIEEMRLHGDIASEDDGEETDETADEDDDDDDANSNIFTPAFPERVIEALCDIGDAVQDVSDKICNALDDAVEKIQEWEFD